MSPLRRSLSVFLLTPAILFPLMASSATASMSSELTLCVEHDRIKGGGVCVNLPPIQ